MPKIYTYKGVGLWFWSNEHDPIHIHARSGGAVIVVKLYVRDGKVYRVTYTPDKGKFAADKEKALRELVSSMKENLREAWIDYFINHRHITPIQIERI
ncbi:MAG: DUF4160 domain-containing protein [Bacteroidales bacterium]|nr:DUF4160 domain-containing protein [Bacteroidales bacterium]